MFWVIGSYLGYPDCCIAAFMQQCERGEPGADGVWTGTGFIPCPAHRDEANANFPLFVAKHITPRRKASTPFPHEPMAGLIERAGWKESAA